MREGWRGRADVKERANDMVVLGIWIVCLKVSAKHNNY